MPEPESRDDAKFGGHLPHFFDQLHLAGPQAVAGGAAVVAVAACVAFVYVLMRRTAGHLHPSVLTAGQMLGALGPLVLCAMLVEGGPRGVPWTGASIGAVLYLAILGSIALVLDLFPSPRLRS